MLRSASQLLLAGQSGVVSTAIVVFFRRRAVPVCREEASAHHQRLILPQVGMFPQRRTPARVSPACSPAFSSSRERQATPMAWKRRHLYRECPDVWTVTHSQHSLSARSACCPTSTKSILSLVELICPVCAAPSRPLSAIVARLASIRWIYELSKQTLSKIWLL